MRVMHARREMTHTGRVRHLHLTHGAHHHHRQLGSFSPVGRLPIPGTKRKKPKEWLGWDFSRARHPERFRSRIFTQRNASNCRFEHDEVGDPQSQPVGEKPDYA